MRSFKYDSLIIQAFVCEENHFKLKSEFIKEPVNTS